jgi:hypothetical protein
MSWIKTPSSSKNTCPGIKEFVRPKVRYLKCHQCNGYIEVWNDEDKGVCIDCGTIWTKPDKTATCLDYCEHSDQCKEIIKE